jgi:hypothetical protein
MLCVYGSYPPYSPPAVQYPGPVQEIAVGTDQSPPTPGMSLAELQCGAVAAAVAGTAVLVGAVVLTGTAAAGPAVAITATVAAASGNPASPTPKALMARTLPCLEFWR